VQHQQEELQGMPSASDLGGTELLLLSNPLTEEQLLQEQVCGGVHTCIAAFTS
jgi:hypothetical protein